MNLTTPIPFAEALAQLQRRGVLPTNLTTAQMRAINDRWHRRSFSSAQTVIADLLDGYKAKIETILNPQLVTRDTGAVVTEGLNLAKARTEIKELQRSLGVAPGDGSITDLTSDKRINLVLETNTAVAQGEGYWLQGQNEAVLDEFPAQELYRVENRKEERDWQLRFRLAGEQTGEPIGAGWIITPDLRMIALKNHLIWEKLADPKLFPDALGNPFEPFAFGSGMGTRDVPRAEAEELGLIQPGQVVQPQRLEAA